MTSITQPAPSARNDANRANAQLSTGPSTPEGKAAIRFNALKHGACSQALLLPYEDAAAFANLGRALREIWEPIGLEEDRVLDRLHECEWRLARMRTADANLCALGLREHIGRFDHEPDPEIRRGLAEASARRENFRQFDQIRRHENALLREHRSLAQSLAELIAVRVAPVVAPLMTDAVVRETKANFHTDMDLNGIERQIRRMQKPSNPASVTGGFDPHKATYAYRKSMK